MLRIYLIDFDEFISASMMTIRICLTRTQLKLWKDSDISHKTWVKIPQGSKICFEIKVNPTNLSKLLSLCRASLLLVSPTSCAPGLRYHKR